jgi:hypothetical protein
MTSGPLSQRSAPRLPPGQSPEFTRSRDLVAAAPAPARSLEKGASRRTGIPVDRYAGLDFPAG